MIEWLQQTWEGFLKWSYEILIIIFEFFENIFITTFGLIYDAIVNLIISIPVPDFLENGADVFFSNLHPDILYFMSMSGLDTSLSILSAGLAFRLLRKIFTLGQW